MKKFLIVSCYLIATCFILSSCEKNTETENPITPVQYVRTTDINCISNISAVLSGEIIPSTTQEKNYEFGFELSKDSAFMEGKIIRFYSDGLSADYSFSYTLSDDEFLKNNLFPETDYYVRAFLTDGVVHHIGETKKLRFHLDITCEVASDFSVKGHVFIPKNNTKDVIFGVCYGTNPCPTVDDIVVTTRTIDENNYYTLVLPNVPFNTILYCRPYVSIDGAVYYGEEQSLAGNSVATIILDDTSCSITSHIACLNGYAKIAYGLCYGKEPSPTINDKKITATGIDENNNYIIKMPSNEYDDGFYCRPFVKIEENIYYGNEVSYEFSIKAVDLGLSVKWANCNVGANSVGESGSYFAWGETEPKEYYDWSIYKYCNGSSTSLTKYCTNSNNGIVDGKTKLDPEDDAAHVIWGGNWRMPTIEEFDELRTKCSWEWISRDNIKGFKIYGSNGNSIFLPAKGFYRESNLRSYNTYGYYSTSSLGSKQDTNSSYLYFSIGGYKIIEEALRCYGRSVRAVTE
ncbi:MAG: hypothetical protein MJY79_05615 [Bacteroidaceae bacterium]|nr:hypothetical protein [Bacteroidaceae bacterium]